MITKGCGVKIWEVSVRNVASVGRGQHCNVFIRSRQEPWAVLYISRDSSRPRRRAKETPGERRENRKDSPGPLRTARQGPFRVRILRSDASALPWRAAHLHARVHQQAENARPVSRRLYIVSKHFPLLPPLSSSK